MERVGGRNHQDWRELQRYLGMMLRRVCGWMDRGDTIVVVGLLSKSLVEDSMVCIVFVLVVGLNKVGVSMYYI